MQLASGNVPVKYGNLSGGFKGTDETVKVMSQVAMGQYGARSPKIRALAANIIKQAGVPEKNYYAEGMALGDWVRQNIRYMRDVYGQETISHPEEVAFNMLAGDCLHEDTRLLTPQGYKAIRDIKVGDIIQGKSGWTRVVNWWDKGCLPTKTYYLSSGGSFQSTDDHKCFLLDGTEVLAKDLEEGNALLGPSDIIVDNPSNLKPSDAYFIGVYLADGWQDGKRFCIAGKDGFAKQSQKVWIQEYAELKGWETSWHERYIRVYIPESDDIFELIDNSGTAKYKRISDKLMSQLNQNIIPRLLEGLLVDSYDPDVTKRKLDALETRKPRGRKGGLCVSTISKDLAQQIRLLYRMMGIGCRITEVSKHGGLGKNPIYRIYPRLYLPKPHKVEEIVESGQAHVYDIETEDHGIYLPDADVVVHNCDDQSVLLAALMGSVGIPTRFKVMGVTPLQYSHVYMQAQLKPGKWINFDPIMTEKPCGWEVPKSQRAIEKTYGPNLPAHINKTGVDGMLGYVGDPRIESHVESPIIPYSAGTGQNQPRPAGAPAYVVMPSGLDNDAPVSHLAKFPPNANAPQRKQQLVMKNIAPHLQRIGPQLQKFGPAGPPAGPIPVDPMHPAEQAAMEGWSQVIGPDALAGMSMVDDVNNQSVPAHMQTKTIRQAPEGVDDQFGRAAQVFDPNQGDKIEYRGQMSLAEKTPIYALPGVAGVDTNSVMPGMAGPGMGMGATGTEEPIDTTAEVVAQPTTSGSKARMVGVGLLAAAGLYLFLRKKGK